MKQLFLATSLALGTLIGSAQTVKPRVSPADSVTGLVNGARITIHYSSPSVKGRVIWGKLVPYDSVWRAGANEATTFETDKDIKVEGMSLPAGKYGFFLLPRPGGKWTAIFNTVPNQWGAFKYDPAKDQLRVNVKTHVLANPAEALNYQITPKGFSLNWEKISVPVAIK
ncbi:MAG TPA: DUF2911 domain-containing protein [Puia sp.]|nr:DUF2911 domain-containing protein [Puia sp.]